jgi:hypothetical protein
MSMEVNGRVTVINDVRTVVYNANDSGLYILFAMECDLFDSPTVYLPPTVLIGLIFGQGWLTVY